MNFQTSHHKMFSGILIGITLNLQINVGKMNILTKSISFFPVTLLLHLIESSLYLATITCEFGCDFGWLLVSFMMKLEVLVIYLTVVCLFCMLGRTFPIREEKKWFQSKYLSYVVLAECRIIDWKWLCLILSNCGCCLSTSSMAAGIFHAFSILLVYKKIDIFSHISQETHLK